MDMFANWVRSCDKHGIDPRAWTLIFVFDSESARQVEQFGFSVFHDEKSYGNQPTDAAQSFGDKKFSRLMFAKTAIVQDVLLLGHHVLFQDADIVWKKDPMTFFLHPSRQELDAQFMYDGPSRYFEPLHANSGFFFLKNTVESRIFWNMVFENYDKILHYGSQQKVVNIVLLSRFFRGLKIDILPEMDFANGHLFCEDKPIRLPEEPYVIHCSWTRNIQHKIEKYKNANLWYL
ncbi:MAG: putative nucleotide-diphospho-sugar transferase [Nitrospirales bacterium]